jgi:DNA-binding beta-propeller fold protein YncE
MMIVGNKDADFFQTQTLPNFTTFSVASTGVLTKLTTFPLLAGDSPAHVLVRQGLKTNFFGILFGTSTSINSYTLTRSGTITPNSSASLAGPPVGGALNPVVRGIYVTVAPNALISLVSYDTAFKLTLQKSAMDPGTAVCWVTVNKAGTRMYTGETASGTISVWDITNPPRTPNVLQTLLMSGNNALPSMVKLDPTEKFLYVLDRHGSVHVLDVAADGKLAESRAVYNLGLPDNNVPPLGITVALK